MKDRRLFAIFVILTCSTALWADGGDKILLYSTGGVPCAEYSIDQIQKITFQKEWFTLISRRIGDENQSFGYGDVASLRFRLGSTGVEKMQEEVTGTLLSLLNGGEFLRVLGCGESLKFSIFDISGRLVNKGLTSGEDVDISYLAPGLYILKVDSQVFKFIKS